MIKMLLEHSDHISGTGVGQLHASQSVSTINSYESTKLGQPAVTKLAWKYS